jgi:purine-binding chemotaxis protein CheW
MSSQALTVAAHGKIMAAEKINHDFVTLTIADQMFGIPVLEVRDVLGPQNIAHVPLAPPEIAGALNLRGRIVTAIDMRIRLGLPPRDDSGQSMSIVVDHGGELYSLIVDKVGEVMSLSASDVEKNPPTLDPQWRDVSEGIYRLKEQLLIALSIQRFLRFDA